MSIVRSASGSRWSQIRAPRPGIGERVTQLRLPAHPGARSSANTQRFRRGGRVVSGWVTCSLRNRSRGRRPAMPGILQEAGRAGRLPRHSVLSTRSWAQAACGRGRSSWVSGSRSRRSGGYRYGAGVAPARYKRDEPRTHAARREPLHGWEGVAEA